MYGGTLSENLARPSPWMKSTAHNSAACHDSVEVKGTHKSAVVEREARPLMSGKVAVLCALKNSMMMLEPVGMRGSRHATTSWTVRRRRKEVVFPRPQTSHLAM